jgi:sRNA-binding carbon storage regulator CsrA
MATEEDEQTSDLPEGFGLILARRPLERMVLRRKGELRPIVVTVVRIEGNVAYVGINADAIYTVDREEIDARKRGLPEPRHRIERRERHAQRMRELADGDINGNVAEDDGAELEV